MACRYEIILVLFIFICYFVGIKIILLDITLVPIVLLILLLLLYYDNFKIFFFIFRKWEALVTLAYEKHFAG